MTTTIKAPSGFTGTSYVGPLTLEFKDGVCEYAGEIPPGALSYMRMCGYGIDGDPTPPEDTEPQPEDPRDTTSQLVGTELRDAAVDPQPGDFLPPVNAGEANPHGPAVVAPGIHAAATGKPIHPGPVGAIGEDKDGNPVVAKDTDVQAENETALAQAVLIDHTPVPEATAAAAKVDPINADQQPAAGEFDPTEHTVDEVNAHLDSADGAETDRVLAAERAGKARKGIVGD